VSEILSTNLVEVLPSLRSPSETHTDSRKTRNTSLLLKVNTPANTFTAVSRLKSLSATFYPLTKSPKVPSFATSKRKSETEVLSLEHLAATLPLLVTLKMVIRPESDSPLELERPFPDLAELPSESLPVVEEPTSLSLRLVFNSTSTPERENHGQLLEVLQ